VKEGRQVHHCGVVVRRDGCGTAVKGDYSGKWNSDDVVLLLGRQNEDVVE
jgi:hypothetical protein